MATAAVDMHPTGMHSCLISFLFTNSEGKFKLIFVLLAVHFSRYCCEPGLAKAND